MAGWEEAEVEIVAAAAAEDAVARDHQNVVVLQEADAEEKDGSRASVVEASGGSAGAEEGCED